MTFSSDNLLIGNLMLYPIPLVFPGWNTRNKDKVPSCIFYFSGRWKCWIFDKFEKLSFYHDFPNWVWLFLDYLEPVFKLFTSNFTFFFCLFSEIHSFFEKMFHNLNKKLPFTLRFCDENIPFFDFSIFY